MLGSGVEGPFDRLVGIREVRVGRQPGQVGVGKVYTLGAGDLYVSLGRRHLDGLERFLADALIRSEVEGEDAPRTQLAELEVGVLLRAVDMV